MKYMCRTCKTKCDDIPKHMITVHKFSKTIVESQLKDNPNCFKNSFEKLKNDRSKTIIQANRRNQKMKRKF